MQIVYALLFLILTLFALPMHKSLSCLTLQPTPVVRILKAPGPEMLHQLLELLHTGQLSNYLVRCCTAVGLLYGVQNAPPAQIGIPPSIAPDHKPALK